MKKTAILLALACAFARADYGPGTTDSDLLRSGTPVVTNAWLAVSNETAGLVRSMAGDKITDGTNTIDAARNVYLVYDNCWIRWDGNILTYIGDNTWKSTRETQYGYIYLYENVQGEWYEAVTPIPDIYYRDGDTLTNYTGMVMYRYGSAKIQVGRLALTNDIPAAPDFTTSNDQLVQTIRDTAPVPGNYSAVSNAAMNARSGIDLGVRGAPQGEGSWFLIIGDFSETIPYAYDSRWESISGTITKNGDTYTLQKNNAARVFSLTEENFYTAFVEIPEPLNGGGPTNVLVKIIGYVDTIAQTSQVPSVPQGVVVTNSQGVVEANIGIYGSLAQGTNVTASGAYSHAEGERATASGRASHAEGIATRASGEASHASGVNVYATQRATFGAGVSVNGTNSASFVWSGQETSPWYGTHGKGSFNVDPIGGIAGMWVGNDALLSILYSSLLSHEPHTATIEFDETAGTTVTTNFPPLREAVVGTIRENSLGGIWDSRLGVWWTPIMENGALRYVAATNVNLSVEGN